MKKNIFILIILTIFCFHSCKKNTEKQAEVDDQIIQKYLKEHSLTATKHHSGLYFLISKEGTGETPTPNSTVEVKYKGYLTDGTVFDQTKDNSIKLNLNRVIEGWKIGIPLIRKKGEATLFIPSKLGYGKKQVGKIPANSVLIFDISLLHIE